MYIVSFTVANWINLATRKTTIVQYITDSTHAPPVGNGIGEPHCILWFFYWLYCSLWASWLTIKTFVCLFINLLKPHKKSNGSGASGLLQLIFDIDILLLISFCTVYFIIHFISILEKMKYNNTQYTCILRHELLVYIL
jgi:hypothetical protein